MRPAMRQHSTRIAVIGIGSMGTGLAYQAHVTPAVRCVALADIDLHRAAACAEFLHHPYRIVRTVADADAAIRDAALAICDDGARRWMAWAGTRATG